MYKQIKDNKGFTIIEIMIVLAIAALILIIVFLAVPALHRSEENTSLKNDASTIAGAVTEFESDNNSEQPGTFCQDASKPGILYVGENSCALICVSPTPCITATTELAVSTQLADAQDPNGVPTSSNSPAPNTISILSPYTCGAAGSSFNPPILGTWGVGVAIVYPVNTGSGWVWGGCIHA